MKSANSISMTGSIPSATTMTRNQKSFRIYVEIGGEPDEPNVTKRMPLSDLPLGAKITNNNPPVVAASTTTEATANGPFIYQFKGSPAEYSAGLKLAIERGWLWMHEPM